MPFEIHTLVQDAHQEHGPALHAIEQDMRTNQMLSIASAYLTARPAQLRIAADRLDSCINQAEIDFGL